MGCEWCFTLTSTIAIKLKRKCVCVCVLRNHWLNSPRSVNTGSNITLFIWANLISWEVIIIWTWWWNCKNLCINVPHKPNHKAAPLLKPLNLNQLLLNNNWNDLRSDTSFGTISKMAATYMPRMEKVIIRKLMRNLMSHDTILYCLHLTMTSDWLDVLRRRISTALKVFPPE